MITIEDMIETQLLDRDITDARVLRAMGEVDRALFVPDELNHLAYEDTPLPIGHGQTISQPYIVAYMAQILELDSTDRVLEIGSGCGYNAGVISRLVDHVYSVEIIDWLAHLAVKNLHKAGITNVSIHQGDGYLGWDEHAPFDKIVITAAIPLIPEQLKNQLTPGGKLLAPVSNNVQQLVLINKLSKVIYKERRLIHVKFVPMTGKPAG